MTDQKPFKDLIIKLTEHITKRKCLVVDDHDNVYADKNYIRYSKNDGEYMLLIHEIGHYLAANKKKRDDLNFGISMFKGHTNIINHKELIEEVKARYFGYLLFGRWLEHTQKINKTDTHITNLMNYGKYLCPADGRIILLREFGISKIVNTNSWHKQLNRRLKEIGISKKTIDKYLI
jgi:hypothetical protein